MSRPEALRAASPRAPRRAPAPGAALSLVAALVAALLVGCADGAVTAPRDVPHLAAVDPGTDVLVVPYETVEQTTCGNGGAGEQVQLSGRLLLTYSNFESAGGISRYQMRVQPQDLSGVGLSSGDAYRMVGGSGFAVSSALTAGQTLTSVSSARLVSAGAGGDMHVHTTVHATVNANGTLTAYVARTTTECR